MIVWIRKVAGRNGYKRIAENWTRLHFERKFNAKENQKLN